MEYTDYCPNCDQQVTVEENPGNYVIKNKKGDVIRHCPTCLMELEVVDGVLSVIKEEE